jgi:hypothetical protein
MEPLVPTSVALPGKNFALWQEQPEPERMVIINREDFPLNETLTGLGIETSNLRRTFAITNRAEIMKRQALMHYLYTHPAVASFVRRTTLNWRLPSEEREFLQYFDPRQDHTPFFTKVREFMALLEGELPDRLAELRDSLEAGLALEGDEAKMAEFVNQRLLENTFMEGIMHLPVEMLAGDVVEDREERREGSGRQIEVIGRKAYSHSILDADNLTLPSWLQDPGKFKKALFGWLITGIQKLQIEASRRRAYEPLVMTEAPENLPDDLVRGILAELNAQSWGNTFLNGATIHIYFRYDKHGLVAQVYDVSPKRYHYTEDFNYARLRGYNKVQLAEVEERAKEFRKRQEMVSDHLTLLREATEAGVPEGFFRKRLELRSDGTDRECRWYAIANIYTDPMVKDVVESQENLRLFFWRHLIQLKDVVEILDSFCEKAGSLGTELCFPEILQEGEDLLEFEEIYPIHLLSTLEPEDIVPIRGVAPISGDTTCYTGWHGGGKTSTAISTAENIVLAQSGLPVFGRGFRLNIKKAIGLVFIDKAANRSTAELLVDKLKRILEGVQKFEGRDVVLVLDELGSATQEDSGLKLGQDVLTHLAKRGVSVIFSTQILELAQFAQNNLGAVCYRFDSKHRIEPGIGDGGMSDLRRRSGLDRLLSA